MKYLLLYLLSFNAFAAPVGNMLIKAEVIKQNSEVVVIKTDDGDLEIPRAGVKNQNVSKGKGIDLIVDSDAYQAAKLLSHLKKNKVEK